ncbi:MAG: efflux RND transporter periplasmic adaptor subunit [Xanthomonadales bacterium]|jgi:HlyD family secretion protein|nr:efflux RND transporter periplasmic adaptor subunit [Xanthomonadales bacterium]
MKIKSKDWIWIVVVGVALATIFFWTNGDETNGSGAKQIETTTIDRGNITRSVATSGAVRPLITVEVGSQLSGQVAQIYADFNTPVAKDQVIALIDTKTFETRVLQSRADLQVAESNVIVQRAGIDRAKANLRRAQLEYERAAPLRDSGTLSASDYDTSLAAYESAKADLTMAEAQLQNAMAAREQRKASLESAEIDLERTKIRSPIDGVVIERAVDQGQTVAASLSSPVLFRIAQDLREIQIEANVDEADIGNVREGNAVSFTVDAYPDVEFSGEVNQVRLASVELNNVVTYTVIITADNPQLKLLPGMTAIVEIVTGASEDVLRVSNDALRFTPPADSELAAAAASETGGASSRGPGGGRILQDLNRMAGDLGLNADQVSAIEKGLQEVLAEMRPQMQGGGEAEGGMDAIREQMRRKIAEVFRDNLSADQYSQYEAMRSQRQSMRSGQLWVQDEDGNIKPVSVRLGISDDQYTQVSGRGIDQGTRVVTKMRAARN